ncbi:ABC transporter permease [Pelagicoccus sp. SDUM812002]|uniref:ABC transporter permease n=1 Tax=Pelagicoccus sp. SDUM812002 TaxID=3041266 RepID=UPI00280CA05B|nr:ABC transporter permease [Pelagicoccus sp. SDUM812002]MDQ8185650.1 ABC transporter permease [Pelagicoccus sp. SDUM812002]
MSIYLGLLVRDSARYWKRKPLQALLSVVLLALGSAAVAVLWTITDSVVRQPLPFPDSHELYGIQSVDEKSGEVVNFMALADFRDFRERQESFTGLFGYRSQYLNYKDRFDNTRQLLGARVTRDFADVLKIHTELGSFFSEDDFSSEAARSVVISYDLWRKEFGSDRNVIGTSIWLDEAAYQVVGVMPKSFNEPSFVNLWTPFPDVTGEYFVRDARYWNVVGRLKPGVTPIAAKQELTQIANDLEEQFPATNRRRGATMDSLQTIIVGDYSTPLMLILVAVSLVMFATCLNLANIQLISGLQRRSENGVRQAIGESPKQAMARAFMEACVICFVGCGLGWCIAALFIANIDSVLPAMFLPRLNEVGMSGTLGWTIGLIALLSSLSFGLLPAVQVIRANTNDIIKSGESRHGLSRESGRSRAALLVGQIAVAVAILQAALLVVHEYRRLQDLDLGFAEDDLLMITVSPGESRMFDLPGLAEFYSEMDDWIESRSAIENSVLTSSPPLAGFDLEFGFQLQGRDLAAEREEAITAVYNTISRDFLESLEISLVQGRSFSDWDNRESQKVAMVNQAFVDKFLAAGEDPLAQQLQIMPWMVPQFRQVVGVVGNYAQTNVTDDPKPMIYVPYEQSPWVFGTFVSRVRDLNTFNLERFETEMKQRYPEVGVSMEGIDSVLERQLSILSLMYIVFVGFGAATLLLSLFGIGSQMAFNVSERSREWGIRLALGAKIGQLNGLVVRRLVVPLSVGCLIGIALFAGSFRFYRQFGGELDVFLLLASALLIAVIVVASVATTWFVSDRITRSNPQEILRSI